MSECDLVPYVPVGIACDFPAVEVKLADPLRNFHALWRALLQLELGRDHPLQVVLGEVQTLAADL